MSFKQIVPVVKMRDFIYRTKTPRKLQFQVQGKTSSTLGKDGSPGKIPKQHVKKLSLVIPVFLFWIKTCNKSTWMSGYPKVTVWLCVCVTGRHRILLLGSGRLLEASGTGEATDCWCETSKAGRSGRCTGQPLAADWPGGSRLLETREWPHHPDPTHEKHWGGNGWGWGACERDCRWGLLLPWGPPQWGPEDSLWGETGREKEREGEGRVRKSSS